jgi:hypothetical protein
VLRTFQNAGADVDTCMPPPARWTSWFRAGLRRGRAAGRCCACSCAGTRRTASLRVTDGRQWLHFPCTCDCCLYENPCPQRPLSCTRQPHSGVQLCAQHLPTCSCFNCADVPRWDPSSQLGVALEKTIIEHVRMSPCLFPTPVVESNMPATHLPAHSASSARDVPCFTVSSAFESLAMLPCPAMSARQLGWLYQLHS